MSVAQNQRRPRQMMSVELHLGQLEEVGSTVAPRAVMPPGGTPRAGMPAQTVLTELARLLGRRAARRQRAGLGLSQAALAPLLLLSALAVAVIVLCMNFARGH